MYLTKIREDNPQPTADVRTGISYLTNCLDQVRDCYELLEPYKQRGIVNGNLTTGNILWTPHDTRYPYKFAAIDWGMGVLWRLLL